MSTPLNSIAFNRSQKYAKFCLNKKGRMFVNHKISTEHHNKSYDYENNNIQNKTCKNQKFSI